MRTLLRAGLLLVAAALLPSCDYHTHWNGWTGDRAHVTIHNLGTTSVDVHAEAEYGSGSGWEDHFDYSIVPGGAKEFYVALDSLTRLRIRVLRSSDAFLLFEDSWDRGDLEDQDDHVYITVDP